MVRQKIHQSEMRTTYLLKPGQTLENTKVSISIYFQTSSKDFVKTEFNILSAFSIIKNLIALFAGDWKNSGVNSEEGHLSTFRRLYYGGG